MAELERQLAVLMSEYAGKLPAKFAAIDAAYRSAEASHWKAAGLEELHQLLHRLAGSGKTFGFAAVTDCSRQAEYMIKGWLERGAEPDHGEIEALERKLEELGTQCRRPAEPAS